MDSTHRHYTHAQAASDSEGTVSADDRARLDRFTHEWQQAPLGCVRDAAQSYAPKSFRLMDLNGNRHDRFLAFWAWGSRGPDISSADVDFIHLDHP
ncbi:MAG: hypothetical protein P8Y27_17895, partial [Chromatiaceae bacterium]